MESSIQMLIEDDKLDIEKEKKKKGERKKRKGIWAKQKVRMSVKKGEWRVT